MGNEGVGESSLSYNSSTSAIRTALGDFDVFSDGRIL